MAWNWSHTTEAYHNARENLADLPIGELITIECEWRATVPDTNGISSDFKLGLYRGEQRKLRRRYVRDLQRGLDGRLAESLADSIWERAEESATCDNGGWNCWICPDGCHTVPFDRVEP